MRFWTKLGYGAGVGLITLQSFLGGAKAELAKAPPSQEETIEALRADFYGGPKDPYLARLHTNYVTGLSKGEAEKYVATHAFQLAVYRLRDARVPGESISMKAQQSVLRIISEETSLPIELRDLARLGLTCAANYDIDANAALTQLGEGIKAACSKASDFYVLCRMQELADAMMHHLGRWGEHPSLRLDLGNAIVKIAGERKHELQHKECGTQKFTPDRSDTYGSIMNYKEHHGHWPP